MNATLNKDGTVAVDPGYFWVEDMGTCPRGVKCQLLGAYGVATYGEYRGEAFWVAWAPLPKRRVTSPQPLPDTRNTGPKPPPA